jgi:hypothetical protein
VAGQSCRKRRHSKQSDTEKAASKPKRAKAKPNAKATPADTSDPTRGADEASARQTFAAPADTGSLNSFAGGEANSAPSDAGDSDCAEDELQGYEDEVLSLPSNDDEPNEDAATFGLCDAGARATDASDLMADTRKSCEAPTAPAAARGAAAEANALLEPMLTTPPHQSSMGLTTPPRARHAATPLELEMCQHLFGARDTSAAASPQPTPMPMSQGHDVDFNAEQLPGIHVEVSACRNVAWPHVAIC